MKSLFKKRLRLINLLLLTWILFPIISEAKQTTLISAAGGYNWTSTKDTDLVISDFETDSVKPQHANNRAFWKVGVGEFFFDNALLVEINSYYNQSNIEGDVWQYKSSAFNNYHFTAPISSERLMLDVKPGLLTYCHITPYPILGIGFSINSASYHEETSHSNVDPNSILWLQKRSKTQFSYDAGMGIRSAVNDHLLLSLEYLYSYAGKVTPSDTTITPASLQHPPTFQIANQSLLLGIGWMI